MNDRPYDYIFLDTETNGLPKNYNSPSYTVSNWPRIIQIGWMIVDRDGNIISQETHLIKPNKWRAKRDMIHGITPEMANEHGVDIVPVLNKFNQLLRQTKYVVGHNIEFDQNVTEAEIFRADMSPSFPKTICTMQGSTIFCELPGTYNEYKWPKLSELNLKLFGKKLVGSHKADADVMATKLCYFELLNKGIMKDPFIEMAQKQLAKERLDILAKELLEKRKKNNKRTWLIVIIIFILLTILGRIGK